MTKHKVMTQQTLYEQSTLPNYQKNSLAIKSKDAIQATDFVPMEQVDSTIKQMKYFLFNKVYDLTGNKIIAQDYDVMALRYSTAKKLKKANSILRQKGYGIVLFDAFRSYDVQQKLGNHYRYIMNSPVNNRTYIEDPGKSRHQKGCAVDIGLYDIKTGDNLMMPTDYFTLDNTSAALYDDRNIDPEVKRLRILQKAMKDAGFTLFTGEWWHFDDFEYEDDVSPYNGNIYEVLKGIQEYY